MSKINDTHKKLIFHILCEDIDNCISIDDGDNKLIEFVLVCGGFERDKDGISRTIKYINSFSENKDKNDNGVYLYKPINLSKLKICLKAFISDELSHFMNNQNEF